MITVKEEFLGSPKWQRAVELGGSDAIVMWLALKGYAASNPTDGFIPDEDIERLPGAPKSPRKALKALVECGRQNRDGSRSAGLVDVEAHGWQLHNYLDHAPSSKEVEERRQKAKERKDKWKERNASGTQPGTQNGTRSERVAERVLDQIVGTPLYSTQAQPSPAQPRSDQPETTTQDLTGQRPGERGRGGDLVACPKDLELTQDQRGALETGLIPGWAIDVLTVRYRGNHSADPGDKRSVVAWRKCLAQAISGWWNNPNQRPKQPVADDETGGYGAETSWEA